MHLAMVHDKLKNKDVALKEGMPMDGDQGGWILTRMTEATAGDDAFVEIDGRRIKIGLSEQIASSAASTIPFGRPGTPDEAAGAIFALCTQDTNFVNAQCLVVDGGQR